MRRRCAAAGNLNRKQDALLCQPVREKVGVMFGSPETPPGGAR